MSEVITNNVRVLRLVYIDFGNSDRSYASLCDITGDPSVEPWFHIARFSTKHRRHGIITKDGISYRNVSLGAIPDLWRNIRFTPKERLVVREAIKHYVDEL